MVDLVLEYYSSETVDGVSDHRNVFGGISDCRHICILYNDFMSPKNLTTSSWDRKATFWT